MKKIVVAGLILIFGNICNGQTVPCTNPMPLNPGSGYGIITVDLNTLNHTTPIEEGYTIEYDSSATTTDLGKCETYDLTVDAVGPGTATKLQLFIDWNEDGDFFDTGEDYTSLLVASVGVISITVPSWVNLGNKFMRVAVAKKGMTPCTSTFMQGDVEDYKINIVENDMKVDSVIVEQAVTCYRPSETCKSVIRIGMHTTGVGNPVTVSSFNLNTAGSTNPGTDISNASIIYTGDEGSFFTCNAAFGATATPNGAFVVNGTQVLNHNTCSNIHYFWLVYDIAAGSTNGNTIDGSLGFVSYNEQGTPIVTIPSTTNPSGSGNVSSGTEICNNGLDDDCDGLIDCYDPDCSGQSDCISEAGAFYYGLPASTCPAGTQFIDPDVGLEVDWSVGLGTVNNSDIANAPLVGDLDGDGSPEIVVQTSHSLNREITIYNGTTGAVLQTVNFTSSAGSNLFGGLIADVDNDGCAEIIWKSSTNVMKCYSYCSASFIWTSTATTFNMGEQINIADLNNDGVAEIYDYAHIWNAQTGALMGTNAQTANTLLLNYFQLITAADLLPDNYCNECAGLELIHGHNIYTVDINAGVATFNNIISSDIEQYTLAEDAMSAVSDLNGDGLLEVATTSDLLFFTWNPRNGDILDSVSIASLVATTVGTKNKSSGPPVINDIDNDGNMEFIFGNIGGPTNTIKFMFGVDENLNYLWHVPGIQLEPSILPVVFDLEGNGQKELITRSASTNNGTNYMYVFDAQTGVKKDSLYMDHGTRTGADLGVVIADVNADGHVEIVTTGTQTPGGVRDLAVITSSTNEWACGRQVWNQLNYHPTFINDDLTVPQQMQGYSNLHTEYNGNSIQASFKDTARNYACPLPDDIVTIDSIVPVPCDSVEVYIEVCNIGDHVIHHGSCDPATYVSFYNGDPLTGGSLIQTDSLSCDLDTVNSCITFNTTIFTGGLTFDLYAYINDLGTNPSAAPSINYSECDTTNNFDFSTVPPDTTIDAGLDGTASFCTGGGTADLMDSIGGTPDLTGTWTPVLTSTTGVFDPATDPAGTYLYIVPGCIDDTAEVVVTIGNPSFAGNDGANTFCLTDPTTDLFSFLTGSPDLGGTWTPAMASTTGDFNPAVDPAGTYYYVVSGTSPCANDTSEVVITLTTSVNAGNDVSINVCPAVVPFDLVDSITGTPDLGGIWEPLLLGAAGLFDPQTDTSGTYLYIVGAGGTCGTDTSYMTVTVYPTPDPGTNGTVTLCANAGTVDLFDSLGGTPNTGGTWSPILNSTTGVFDPLVDLAGTYTYEVSSTANCPVATADVVVSISTSPNAGVDGTAMLCPAGATVNLIDSLGGSPDATGTWTPALTGGSNGGFSPQTNTAGVYQYIILGTGGCANDTSEITVSIYPTPDPGTNGTAMLCLGGGTVDLFDSLGGAPNIGGTWTPTLNSTTGVFNPAIDAAGTYTYEISGTINCPNATANVVVSIATPPDAGINGTAELCANGSAFAAIDSLGGIPGTSGTWSPTLTGGQFNPASNTAGTYTYTILGTNGCADASADLVVSINAAPIINLGAVTTFCQGDSLLLDAGNAGSTYVWTPNGETAQTIYATSAGTFGVTVTSANNCIETSSITITETSTPSVNIAGDTSLCLGESTTLIASTGVATWNTTEVEDTIINTPTSNGWFWATNSNSCGSSTDSLYVTVNPLPIASAGNDTTIMPLASVTLSGSGGVTYTWSPTDGLSCANCENPTLSISSDATYCVTATDSNGCSSTDCISITIDLTGEVWAPNIFSPNNDGLNDLFFIRGPINPDLFNLVIYSRWGEKVFETSDPSLGWNGTHNGEIMNTAAFAYVAIGTTWGGNDFKLEGNITLLVK